MAQQQSLFPTRDSLEQVQQEALAALPITNRNDLMALLQLQQNTLIAILSRPDTCYMITFEVGGDLRYMYVYAGSPERAIEIWQDEHPRGVVVDIDIDEENRNGPE